MEIIKVAKRGMDKLLSVVNMNGVCKRYENDIFTVVVGNSENEVKFTSRDLNGLKMAIEALEEQQQLTSYFAKCDSICKLEPQIKQFELDGKLSSTLNTMYDVPLAQTARIAQAYFKYLKVHARVNANVDL